MLTGGEIDQSVCVNALHEQSAGCQGPAGAERVRNGNALYTAVLH